jgi:hypothetical protein
VISEGKAIFQSEGTIRCAAPELSDKYVIDEAYVSYDIAVDYVEFFYGAFVTFWHPILGWHQWNKSPIKKGIFQNYAENIGLFASVFIPGINYPWFQDNVSFRTQRVENKSNISLKNDATISKRTSDYNYFGPVPIAFTINNHVITNNADCRRETVVDLKRASRESLLQGCEEFTIKAIVGDNERPIQGAKEFVFKFNANDFTTPLVLLTEVLSAPRGCKIYESSVAQGLEKCIGEDSVTNKYSGFDIEIPKKHIRVSDGEVTSDTIMLPASRANRTITFHEKTSTTVFSSDIEGLSVLIGKSPKAMEKKALPLEINRKKLVFKENNEGVQHALFAQFIKNDYLSDVFSIPASDSNQTITAKPIFITESITSDQATTLDIDGGVFKTPYKSQINAIEVFINGSSVPFNFPSKKVVATVEGAIPFTTYLTGNTNRYISLTTKKITDTVTSTPNGADILEHGIKIGTTPFSKTYHSFDVKFALPQQNVILQKSGYKKETVAMLPSQKDRSNNITLEKLPSGFVKLTSNEDNVQIYVNGELFGTIKDKDTPFNFSLPLGQHRITAKKEFFREKSFNVKMGENELAEIEFEIKKAADWNQQKAQKAVVIQSVGELRALTTRTDLKVVIDGTTKTAPFVLKDVPSGEYKIQIIGDGIKKTITIQVDDGETEILNLDEII